MLLLFRMYSSLSFIGSFRTDTRSDGLIPVFSLSRSLVVFFFSSIALPKTSLSNVFFAIGDLSFLTTMSTEKVTIVPQFGLLRILISPDRALTRDFALLRPLPMPVYALRPALRLD